MTDAELCGFIFHYNFTSLNYPPFQRAKPENKRHNENKLAKF